MAAQFIRRITINKDQLTKLGTYAAGIPAIRSLEWLDFDKSITFFCGENGSGKSTLLEAIALACGLNGEGGTSNYRFITYDDTSVLCDALRISRGISRPKRSYFLRAETFYNMATAGVRDYGLDKDYHAFSHGESFIEFILDNRTPGLYLMDEPEAALSPQRQLELLAYLVKMGRAGAQFIIATHSPILLGTPGAQIFSFDREIHPIEYEDTESYQTMKLFINNRERYLQELLKE